MLPVVTVVNGDASVLNRYNGPVKYGFGGVIVATGTVPVKRVNCLTGAIVAAATITEGFGKTTLDLSNTPAELNASFAGILVSRWNR